MKIMLSMPRTISRNVRVAKPTQACGSVIQSIGLGAEVGRRQRGPGRSDDPGGDLVNAVVAVAELVPLRALGLAAAGQVGGPGPEGDITRSCRTARSAPTTASCAAYARPRDAPLASRRRSRSPRPWRSGRRPTRPGRGPPGRRARPPDPAAGSVISARTRWSVTGSRDLLAVAIPVVDVLLGLVVALEGPVAQLDLGEPFHRRHAVPAGHHQPQGEPVLERQRLAIHRVGQDRVRVARLVDREAALEVDLAALADRPRRRRRRGTGPRSRPRARPRGRGSRRAAPRSIRRC